MCETHAGTCTRNRIKAWSSTSDQCVFFFPSDESDSEPSVGLRLVGAGGFAAAAVSYVHMQAENSLCTLYMVVLQENDILVGL